MEDEDEDSEEALQKFLGQWKEELQYKTGISSSPRKRGIEQRRLSEPSSLSNHDSPSVKRPSIVPNQAPPLLVLPAGSKVAVQFQRIGKGEPEEQTPNNEDLVCKLISDLDEINTIPFFEVQLPRELALIIFSYLSIKDLCTCALVSRSWNLLAEDDLLWQEHYENCLLKFNGKRVDRYSEWKSAVQDLIVRRQQVERNWKERICGLSDYQPDDCRVLCCLSYSNRTVLSCYSSGALRVWNLESEQGPAHIKQVPGSNMTSQPACCDLVYPWGAVGTTDGYLKVVDVETCSLVHSFLDLGSVNCLSLACIGSRPSVGVAYQLPSLTRSSLMVYGTDNDGRWHPQHVPLGEIGLQRLTKLKLLSPPQSSSCSVLYSTSSSLTVHPISSSPTHILSSVGKEGKATLVSCFQCDNEQKSVACAGTNAFGYWVQLFDLAVGSPKAFLKGHSQPVTSLSFNPLSTHMLVSGSVDKRVHVYDCRNRTSFPSLILRGHSAVVRSVQMDGWKAVSGSSDGTLIVWDTRMSRELWNTHERHAVEVCCVDDPYLICGHIPVDKHPTRVDATGENPNICHRRLRGLVRVMDFSVDPLFYTKKLPSICSSAYDEPLASSFNLDLMFPYDDVS